MTEQNDKPTLADEQIQLLRTSLTATVFQKYLELIKTLKQLPIQQNIPGINQAYLFIDSGILWFKEVLTTGPLIFGHPTPVEDKKEEIVAPEVCAENPESKTDQESA